MRQICTQKLMPNGGDIYQTLQTGRGGYLRQNPICTSLFCTECLFNYRLYLVMTI